MLEHIYMRSEVNSKKFEISLWLQILRFGSLLVLVSFIPVWISNHSEFSLQINVRSEMELRILIKVTISEAT